jgi:hypothetical protein
MTIYARSDLCYVAVSRDHGGCGESHARPVVAGAPAKVWALTCAPCEDHLRSDKLWSSQVTTIPETMDEENARKDVEKRGAVEQAQSVADALGQLAKLGDLPAVLGQFMQYMTTGQIAPAAPIGAPQADIVATPEPAPAPQLPAASPEPEAAPETPEAPVEDAPLPKVEDLDNMNLTELREVAKQVGAPITRSREDQITVLKEKLG